MNSYLNQDPAAYAYLGHLQDCREGVDSAINSNDLSKSNWSEINFKLTVCADYERSLTDLVWAEYETFLRKDSDVAKADKGVAEKYVRNSVDSRKAQKSSLVAYFYFVSILYDYYNAESTAAQKVKDFALMASVLDDYSEKLKSYAAAYPDYRDNLNLGKEETLQARLNYIVMLQKQVGQIKWASA